MILIIAEKPSLARTIAAALGERQTKGSGFISVGQYIVTWAFAHLFSLADIEYYNPRSGGEGWTLENLPCFPERFHFELRADSKQTSGKPASGKRRGSVKTAKAEETDTNDTPQVKNYPTDDSIAKQFETIRALCLRDDVDTIVNAGDSDREGEIIVRLCIINSFKQNSNVTDYSDSLAQGKRLCRLWLPDQMPETIRSAVAELHGESEFDRLADEGFARTFVDWLYGVNLTRYATLRSGMLLRVGRVIVPIVKAIYDRDLAIRNFKPEKYYVPFSNEKTNGETVELTSKLKFTADSLDAAFAAAKAKCDEYNRLGARVVSVKRKKDKINPGKLWSLTKLQNYLGRKYKMSMTDSLDIVQSLYEKGFVTYPRTNSEYLATAEKERIHKVIDAIGAVGYPVKFKDGKQIFDDTKVESHSALTPTAKIPSKDKLTPDEAKVYTAIIRRFCAVFCNKDCIAEKTELVIRVGNPPETGEDFTLKGLHILEPGWTKYDDYNGKDKLLPALSEGDEVNINFSPVEKETTPPKHYTIETLNNYLKNPFRDELAAKSKTKRDNAVASDDNIVGESIDEGEDDRDEYRAIFEGLELGTEATRTSIIDNARKSGYIKLNKDVYTILPHGEYLIESLARMNIGMDKYKTASLGRALKRVYRGEITPMDAAKLAEREISAVFNQENPDGWAGDDVGVCPFCGGRVVRSRYGYGCSRYRDGCKFKINRQILGRPISLAEAQAILNGGTTGQLDGFTSKNGKPFSAALNLVGGEVKFDFSGSGRYSDWQPSQHAVQSESAAQSESVAKSEYTGKSQPVGDKPKLIPGIPVDDTFG